MIWGDMLRIGNLAVKYPYNLIMKVTKIKKFASCARQKKYPRCCTKSGSSGDAALAEQAAELSAQAAKLAKCGNRRIYHTSYTGNRSSGVNGPCSGTYVHGGNMYVRVPSAQVICTARLSGDGKTLR